MGETREAARLIANALRDALLDGSVYAGEAALERMAPAIAAFTAALPPADQRETPTCQTCKARLCVHDGSAMCITARCPHYREVIVLADATRGAETLREALAALVEAAQEVNARYVGGSTLEGRLGAALDELAVAQLRAQSALRAALRTP
jgi:hypothetical protein